MDVFEAVESRYSCRSFLDQPVDPQIIRELIERATRAANSGNLQPWQIHALAGAPLLKFKRAVASGVANSNPFENETEFPAYPAEIWEPYKSRREQMGAQLYGSLKIDRTNLPRRLDFYRRNFDFFGAPVGLLFFIDRHLGSAQWADLGSYVQTLMCLARGHGLDSCAQVSWIQVHTIVREFLNLPPEQMLFCGMSIGYGDRDHPANCFRTHRAPVEEFCTFHGFD